MTNSPTNSRADDSLALRLWHDTHDEMLQYFQRRVHSQAVAEDLTQDVFETMIAQASRLQTHPQPKRWLFRVARTTWIDHGRRMSEDALPEFVVNRESTEQDAMSSLVETIAGCLDDLARRYAASSPTDADLLLSVFRGQKTQKDAAAELGVPYSTFKSRVQRARSAIADAFRETCCRLIQNQHGHIINCQPVSAGCNGSC